MCCPPLLGRGRVGNKGATKMDSQVLKFIWIGLAFIAFLAFRQARISTSRDNSQGLAFSGIIVAFFAFCVFVSWLLGFGSK